MVGRGCVGRHGIGRTFVVVLFGGMTVGSVGWGRVGECGGGQGVGRRWWW